jgi:membrane dipeptidase
MSDQPVLIVDSHLDLAFSAIQVNRDLTRPAAAVRIHDREPVMRSFGSCTVTFPELRKGRVGIVFGTVMFRIDPNDAWTRTGMYCQE